MNEDLKDVLAKTLRGDMSYSEAYIILNNAKKELELMIGVVKEKAILEAKEQGKEGIVFNGFKAVYATKKNYDYSNTPQVKDAEYRLKMAQENAKKALESDNGHFIDLDTGDVYNPPIIKLSEFVQVKEVK